MEKGTDGGLRMQAEVIGAWLALREAGREVAGNNSRTGIGMGSG